MHPQHTSTDESNISSPAFPTTYLGNFFQHLLLWGLESSEQEAEVKKERLEEGGPWYPPHTRSSLEIYSSEVQTLANHKEGVQPEHDKWWDSSALWIKANYAIKIWMSSFNPMIPLVHISVGFKVRIKMGLEVGEGAELSIHFHLLQKMKG